MEKCFFVFRSAKQKFLKRHLILTLSEIDKPNLLLLGKKKTNCFFKIDSLKNRIIVLITVHWDNFANSHLSLAICKYKQWFNNLHVLLFNNKSFNSDPRTNWVCGNRVHSLFGQIKTSKYQLRIKSKIYYCYKFQ